MANTTAKQDKYNRILLDTFRFLIEFLEAHGLRWFVYGGTCIGAVRDKGLIPWDDDVDICMPKEDLDTLFTLRDELEKSHYKLVSPSDKGYDYAHCKLIDTDTTLWEEEWYPFITGVFVDIFPIYTTELQGKELKESMLKYRSLFQNCLRTVKRIPFKSFLKSLFIKHDRIWIEYLINKIRYPHSKFKAAFTKFHEYESRLDMKHGETALCYSSFKYGEKEILKSEYFSDYIEMPFEDFNVRVPVGYHEYLSQVFGDYMTPPPEDKRVVEHSYLRYYINLNEGLTLAEVKKRIKMGEREVY